MADNCFNRYMVECECNSLDSGIITTVNVLIDTWWNVNVYRSRMEFGGYLVLIDTWWNVNIPVARDSKLKQAF